MSQDKTAANKGSVSENSPDLTVSEIHDLLSSSRRRAVLDVLMDQAVVQKSDLVDAVAAEECDTTIDAVSGQRRKRVHVSLHQVHIPKLKEAGVLEGDTRNLSIGPNGHRVNQFRHDSRSGVVERLKKAIR